MDTFSYSAWRFRYYGAVGNMTYDQIDHAVANGKIKIGDMPLSNNEIVNLRPSNAKISDHAPKEDYNAK